MPKAEHSQVAQTSALLAYLLFVAYQSLEGGRLAAAGCGLPLLQQGVNLSWSDGLANLVAYMPLGLLVAAWLGPPRRGAALLAGFLAISVFSLSMELLQACLDKRVSSWFDWSTNSAGALIGLLVLPRLGSPLVLPGRGSLAWPVFLCAGAWVALSWAPWRFTFDLGTISGNLSFLRRLPDWAGPEPWRFARHLFGWLTLGVALRALLPGRGAATLALALVALGSVFGQMFVARKVLSLDELSAIVLALGLAATLPSMSSSAVLARLVPVLAVLSIAAYQLQPGAGAVLYGSGFNWWPRIGRGGMLSALAQALMYCWLAFAMLLSLRWLEARGDDIGRRKFFLPALVLGALLASEFAQGSIAGRIPDSSPPLVTGLAFLVAWALFGPPARAHRRRFRDPARPRAHPLASGPQRP
jgi:VanZ family protein